MKIVNKLGQVVEVPDSYDPKRIKALGWEPYTEQGIIEVDAPTLEPTHAQAEEEVEESIEPEVLPAPPRRYTRRR